MKNEKQLLGKKGEDYAVNFLERLGYRVLVRNCRVKSGEIDIVAMQGEELVFVEVRTKKNSNFGLPIETVNFKKRRQIEKNARLFLAANRKFEHYCCRFDVIGILLREGREPDLKHIVNAFLAGE
jgi:putative endonuclease